MCSTTNWCVQEVVEEAYDRYEEILEKDPLVQNVKVRVCDMIGCIRDVLTKGNAPAEALCILDDLEDEVVNLVTEILKTLARDGCDKWNGCNDIQIAYELGRMYCELEKRHERLQICDSNENVAQMK